MPSTAPGSIDEESAADIIAFLLEANGSPAGDTPLGANDDDDNNRDADNADNADNDDNADRGLRRILLREPSPGNEEGEDD